MQLSTSVINTGSNEQDDTELEVSNANLGVSFKETFDLTDDPFDADSKFSKTFTFTVADDVPPSVYPITSKVTFDDGKQTETETVDLVVRACDVDLIPAATEEEDKSEVVVVQPPVIQPIVPTGGITAQPVTAPRLSTTEEKSLFQSTGFLAALVAGEVLLVIVAILIVVAVIRKRS